MDFPSGTPAETGFENLYSYTISLTRFSGKKTGPKINSTPNVFLLPFFLCTQRRTCCGRRPAFRIEACQTLISTSTPLGSSSFMSASMVLEEEL